MKWSKADEIAPPKQFTCGFCGAFVGSKLGYNAYISSPSGVGSRTLMYIRICPACDMPTIMAEDQEKQYPGVPFGNPVEHVPAPVSQAYEEARKAAGVNAYTAAVLVCRKILMQLAVNKGADEGKKFAYYVDYLNSKGYTPPDAKQWVDDIRTMGNEATHKIVPMGAEQARTLILFVEMLLRFIYEFPQKSQKIRSPKSTK